MEKRPKEIAMFEISIDLIIYSLPLLMCLWMRQRNVFWYTKSQVRKRKECQDKNENENKNE